MPTNDELQASIVELRADNTALTDRVKVLEDTIAVVQRHTIQRSQVTQLTKTLMVSVAEAVQRSNLASEKVDLLDRANDDTRALLLGLTDSLIANEEPTGTIDSSNRDFTTNNPYKAGSLIVYLNNATVFTDAYYTETDPDAGAFKLAVAPDTGDAIRVSYIIADS